MSTYKQPPLPTLEVTKQTAISEERVTKRGKTCNVYIVVKNSPFQLNVALKNSNITFNHLSFDISLIYDMLGYNKEVAYVSTKPVDYRPSVNDAGDEISFDVKVKVLSSHHEDNFFRLKLILWDPNNPQFPQLMVLSYPIKVISKPVSQRKPRKRAASTRRGVQVGESVADLNAEVPIPLSSSPTSIVSPQQHQLQKQLHPASSESVSPMTDVNLESKLERLENQQNETLQLVRLILEGQQMPSAKRMRVEADNNFEFETAFSYMLLRYSRMNAEQKAETMRRMLRTLGPQDREQLEELIDILSTTGLKNSLSSFHQSRLDLTHMQLQSQQPTHQPHQPHQPQPQQPTPGGHVHGGECGHDCHHRVELSRLDQFYNEVYF